VHTQAHTSYQTGSVITSELTRCSYHSTVYRHSHSSCTQLRRLWRAIEPFSSTQLPTRTSCITCYSMWRFWEARMSTWSCDREGRITHISGGRWGWPFR